MVLCDRFLKQKISPGKKVTAVNIKHTFSQNEIEIPPPILSIKAPASTNPSITCPFSKRATMEKSTAVSSYLTWQQV